MKLYKQLFGRGLCTRRRVVLGAPKPGWVLSGGDTEAGKDAGHDEEEEEEGRGDTAVVGLFVSALGPFGFCA